MSPTSKTLTFALLLVTCAGCSSKKTVTITDESGNITLKYDCSRFQSQVKTKDETHALIRKSNEVRIRANQENNQALLRSLHTARELYDTLHLEELVVMDECAHQK
jgi:hypothetical protein